ncbi:hypothetical protein BCR44DRAFT_52825 [Catenaria anguillulae PL171]|uniref:AN1-type domain-containing protein n=1 Tax=Catenaria anguillulae PL171 TaxID=765915 RepID=A0A1Y2HD67_9FUNG|nr:hypothetical protein BCR44DRAFT_52825 [Catenaria anguillulae PL171]
MELPHIGKHCSVKTCNLNDFLPYTCPGCKAVYCHDHWRHADHECSNPPSDRTVPSCPLCNQVVPIRQGDDPNLRVDQHIAAGCPVTASNASRAPPSKKCCYRACAAKTMVPVQCKACHLTFCLKHRLERDHECNPPPPPTATQEFVGKVSAKFASLSLSGNANGAACSGSLSSKTGKSSAGKKDKSKSKSKDDCTIM